MSHGDALELEFQGQYRLGHESAVGGNVWGNVNGNIYGDCHRHMSMGQDVWGDVDGNVRGNVRAMLVACGTRQRSGSLLSLATTNRSGKN